MKKKKVFVRVYHNPSVKMDCIFYVTSKTPQDILAEIINQVCGGCRIAIAEGLAENHKDLNDEKMIAYLDFDGTAILPWGKAKYLDRDEDYFLEGGRNKTVRLFAQTHEGCKQHDERVAKAVEDFKNRVDKTAEYWIARGYTLTLTRDKISIMAKLQKRGDGTINLGYVNLANALYYTGGRGKNSIDLLCE